MKRALKWLGAAFLALHVLALVAGWLGRESLAIGLLVLTPSPEGLHRTRPADARSTLEVSRAGATVRAWVFEPARAARATVLMLHGIRSDKRVLVASARAHARRGIRAIAIDARGHGESSGRFHTYGVEEARDMVALVDLLARQEMLTKPLAVVGSSYGGATALQFAAIDPRVDTVVAMAPFASLREVVPAYVEWFLGPPGRWVPASHVNTLIDVAARRAGFNADLACPRCVAPRIKARVLLVHSRDDERIPFGQSVAIRKALTAPAELMLIDGPRHVATGRGPGVAAAIARWLDVR